MTPAYLLTCEHAGNLVPAPYQHLFKDQEEVLYSHRAMDFGALRLARHLARELNLPLHYTTISRLLVENNRSLDSDELFSPYSKILSPEEQQAVLEKYYHPHRRAVTNHLEREIQNGNQVIHLAIHSFTPVMNGEVREADIGLLFDPERPLEKRVAAGLREALAAQNPGRKILFNAPYPGITDGLPTHLRRQFSPDTYAGFEIEVNQKFFLDGEAETWDRLVTEFTEALKQVRTREL